jgi:hypothetical protein
MGKIPKERMDCFRMGLVSLIADAAIYLNVV